MNWDWPVRLLFALVLSGIVGFEREARQRSAGLRTHMLVGMGAALFTLVSLHIPGGDPARIAAQIVTGVGFLGAGVIFRQGTSVRGLTTAASLWVVAAVGMVCGVGRLAEASLAAGTALVILAALRALDRRVRSSHDLSTITIRADHGETLGRAIGIVTEHDVPASGIRLSTSDDARLEVSVHSDRVGPLCRELSELPGLEVEAELPRAD